MKHLSTFLMILAGALLSATAQNQSPALPVADNLVAEGLPPIPTSIIQEVRPYTEARAASLSDWHPVKKEMVISTRFANTPQLHYLKMAGGARKQLTYENEPISSTSFEPNTGKYLLLEKDMGGNEFDQIYRFSFENGSLTLLTDGGKSQNGGIVWNKKGDKIVYSSTRRNGADRDVYMMNPLDKATDKLVVELTGGGWGISDWSDDESIILLDEYISVNESRIWTFNTKTGEKKRILPVADERTVYSAVAITSDNRGMYLLTTSGSEFNKLAFYNFQTKKLNILTADINWDITSVDVSEDEQKIAFVANEAGISKLFIMNTQTGKYSPVSSIPTGLIGGLEWHKNNTSLGFSYGSSNSSSDIYEWNTSNNQLIRWTESELGGIDASRIQAPQLIKWKSFDGLEISGFMYPPDKKFTGKRPVIINIHGGPEGQSRPQFIGRNNYYLQELGICIIFPNVRGSTGFGKTFTDMDNGFKREESVKDIGALIDWIARQPDLDASRIMITGGSYGGYMTLACAFHYNDKIRCSLDVVGISNFNTFLKNTESYRRDLRRVEYGDERDPAMAAFFEKIAPLNNVEKITKPIFIVQGKNDPRVPYTEAQQMAEKIRANGGKVWYLMANDEGHGFGKKNNQDFQFYSTIEFIKQNLLN